MTAHKKIIYAIIGCVVIAALGGFMWAKSSDHLAGELLAATNDLPGDEVSGQYHRSTTLDPTTIDAYYQNELHVSPIKEAVSSAVVPHHLVAGNELAGFFDALKGQNPSVVVIIGPNHPDAGRSPIITSVYSWKTPYGMIAPASDVVTSLVNSQTATIDEKTIDTEHSIGALVPFVKHTWGNAIIVPLILKSTTPHEQIDKLVNDLHATLPANSLVLVSVDFSHYLPVEVANFHDELSLNVLETADVIRLNKLEIDSEPSLYALFKYNELTQAQHFTLVAHSNSGTILQDPDLAQTTSHILGYYTVGDPSHSGLISLQFFGDIMLDRNVAKAMGNEGLDYVFRNLHGEQNRFFKGADLFIPNLEGPFAPTRIPTSKTIAFRFDPKWVTQLKQYNIGAVTLANNHSVDMGWSNVSFTENLLESAGIHHFGREYKEGPEFNWVTNEAQGRQVSPPYQGGVRGGSPSFAEPLSLPEPVAFVAFETVDHQIDKAKVLAALEDAKKKSRYVIAVVHGGTEYRRTSTPEQQQLYRWLIDNGAIAVIAHHPHVVEETEIYKGAPIIYSLGNFVFDQYFSVDTQQGLSVGLTLQDGKVKSLYFFPMQSVKSQDGLMMGKERDSFLSWVQTNSRLNGLLIQNGLLRIAH